MEKQKVLILFGGKSNEHEVSLRSAAAVVSQLDRSRFTPILLGVTKAGGWRLYRGKPEELSSGNWEAVSTPAILSPDRTVGGVVVQDGDTVRVLSVDVVFPVMHGQQCEDGVIQGLLELSGIPYVGCRVMASAACFDKALTHIVAERCGIPMAKWELVTREESQSVALDRIEASLGYPCFVKPANSGSSVGCSRANDRPALEAALALAYHEDRRVIVEELVEAHEVECAVLGNHQLEAPTTGEIVTVDGFYDYDTKYKTDTAKLLIPAGISPEAQAEVRRLAQEIYRALDCRGLSRVDFFVQQDGRVLFNEINTLPGFTSISMYPKMMTADGSYSYPALITRLIELALAEHGGR